MSLRNLKGGTRSRPSAIPRSGTGALLGLLLFLALVPTVTAHGGAARLIVTPDPVNPGGTIEVRGEDLSADAAIKLVLVGSDGRTDIAMVDTDGQGHAVAFVRLPAELPTGIYAIHAVDPTGAAIKAPLEVAGPPITDGGGEPGGRDEDDGLLVALPPGWQQSLSDPAVTAVPVTTTTTPSGSGAVEPGPALRVVLAVAVIAVVLAVVAGGMRRSRGRTEASPRS